MGETKRNITGRFTAANVQHIFTVCLSRFPHLSVSAALNLICDRDRAAQEASQHLLCPTIQPRKVIDSIEGQGTEGGKNFAQGGKGA